MTDKYYAYRPMLDLIGKSEGTDKGRGYNETLNYGAYTGGNVNLVGMTLAQIDELQGQMLAHPQNKLNSSALGRYQIVRTTRRSVQSKLGLAATELFDAEMQDRMGCYLLGLRGIDQYVSGAMTEDDLIGQLAKEWASLPTLSGKGYYGGQKASVTVEEVRTALREVKKRRTAPSATEKIAVATAALLTPAAIFADWYWAVALAFVGGVAFVALKYFEKEGK